MRTILHTEQLKLESSCNAYLTDSIKHVQVAQIYKQN